MKATLERTKADRMTDMYVVRMEGLQQIKQRFLCFTRAEWEQMYPKLLLKRGEKRKIDLTFDENGV
jgi:hypothetical protein